MSKKELTPEEQSKIDMVNELLGENNGGKPVDIETLIAEIFQSEMHKTMLETNPEYKEELEAQQDRVLEWAKKEKEKKDKNN